MAHEDIIKGYMAKAAEAAAAVDSDAVSRAANALLDAHKRGARVFVMGNGGSAATADHFAADFEKNAFPAGPKPRVLSLAGQAAKILAYGNDISFDAVFAEQLRGQGSAGDVAILISASGNSPNILRALGTAREMNMQTIGLTGFSGGALREGCDIPVHFPCDSYELSEDMHSMTCHLLVQCCKAAAE